MMKTENTVLQMIAGAARCPEYGPDMVKALMEKLDMNERAFALLTNVAPSTIRLWTSGAAQPSGTARRLIDLRGRAGDRREDRRGALRRQEGFIDGRYGTSGSGTGCAAGSPGHACR